MTLMRQLDELFLGDPTLGVLGMQDELNDLGLVYNEKWIRQLMTKMCLEAIFLKRNLSSWEWSDKSIRICIFRKRLVTIFRRG